MLPVREFVTQGPSPRAWGSRAHHGPVGKRRRSIPTCVGLTLRRLRKTLKNPVHPHVRGAHSNRSRSRGLTVGPSPRAWGSLFDTGRTIMGGRSIPTCVGLTRPDRSCGWSSAVHPHVRGAHILWDHLSRRKDGPSPRAWGSRIGIPQEAGSSSVHPHVRGAHSVDAEALTIGVGPSPRAWGSRGDVLRPLPALRSIPTCVGLTARPAQWQLARKVHPHVRGAHAPPDHRRSTVRGPSPRAWGSPGGTPAAAAILGSIPTCVGLTISRYSRVALRTVHPHVRGAHPYVRVHARDQHGPSPRAWGSQRKPLRGAPEGRSIPTCVGLTIGRNRPCCPQPVHPHVRGAHRHHHGDDLLQRGPSPRAWGSLNARVGERNNVRSIPTCVGLTR